MAKFDKAKVGDRVWYVACQSWGRIISIDKEDRYPIRVKGEDWEATFTLDGKYGIDYDYVSLFWNEFHIPTDEEDKKPFNLVEFLTENLTKINFKEGEENLYLAYICEFNRFAVCSSGTVFNPTVVYFDTGLSNCDLEEILYSNDVTADELVKAYKELEWL